MNLNNAELFKIRVLNMFAPVCEHTKMHIYIYAYIHAYIQLL